jgi:hypothetical protein
MAFVKRDSDPGAVLVVVLDGNPWSWDRTTIGFPEAVSLILSLARTFLASSQYNRIELILAGVDRRCDDLTTKTNSQVHISRSHCSCSYVMYTSPDRLDELEGRGYREINTEVEQAVTSEIRGYGIKVAQLQSSMGLLLLLLLGLSAGVS